MSVIKPLLLQAPKIQTVTSRLAPSLCVHSLPASMTRKNQWNKAVSEAEKLVGYPTSLVSVRALMDDDFANIAVHMRKLIGSDHPVLHTVKRLVYQGRNKMQLRGLIMLLLSRAAGPNECKDYDKGTGVLEKQRKLAEIVEMINTAQAIHQSVVNLPVNIASEEDEELRGILSQLEYGNKISILGGDYLLANACTGLAALRITKIVEIISIAIAEFTQAEFIGKQDPQGRVVPTEDQLDLDSWLARAKLSTGSLLGAGCQGTMLAAGHDEHLQDAARQLGLHLALAIRAHDEKMMFTEEGGMGSGSPFSLATAPVMFHLQQDKELLEYIQTFSQDLSMMNYRKVFEKVADNDGVAHTARLCEEHVDKSLEILGTFGDNDATAALRKIAISMTS